MEEELVNRQKYQFPPFNNLLLLTTQEKDYQKSLQKLHATKEYLEKMKSEIPGISWGKVYPARLLRRKGYYSHHLLLKFPKNYSHFPILQKTILGLASLYKLQVRLNPRHTF
jgi:primosomal protein N' (replication factor Y)